MSNTFKEVRIIISNTMFIPVDQVKENSRFADDLGMDSLDKLSVMQVIESEYKCEVASKDVEKIVSVDMLVDYIDNYVKCP